MHRTGPQSKPVLLLNGMENIWLWALLETVAFALALPATVGLLMLLGWHIHLVLINKSTIEYQEVRRGNAFLISYRIVLKHNTMMLILGRSCALVQGVRSRVQDIPTGEHPYDLGAYHNMHQILGDNILTWACPPCTHTRGGEQYITRWDMAKHGLS